MSLDTIVNVLAGVTLTEMMVTLGLGADASELADVGRHKDLPVRAFFANYVIVRGRLLSASTGAKDPRAQTTIYASRPAAPFTVNTCRRIPSMH